MVRSGPCKALQQFIDDRETVRHSRGNKDPSPPSNGSPRMPRNPRSVLAQVAATSLLAAGGLVALVLTAPAAQAAVPLNASDVTANLWEWNWNSISAACTNQLGPAGYGAVQVA